ncbi:MAG: chemotaxis protein CheD [Chloroflexota bacterium]
MENGEYTSYYLFPSTMYATRKPCMISTILGSCVAVCLWDSNLRYGGMNHFMLPLWNGKGLASPKYGNIAIQKLYEKMLSLGCLKENLQAKVFGGGDILQASSWQFNIGARNIGIAGQFLSELGIPVQAMSVGGPNGRKILFDSEKGTVIQRYIEKMSMPSNNKNPYEEQD